MMEEKSINTGKGTIVYWIKRPREGETFVVYLHGLSSNHLNWDPFILPTEKAGYGVLTLDLRGHGLSDKSRKRPWYTIPRMREDIELILKKEAVTSFSLVGYSYGAYITLDFGVMSALKPKSIVLVSPNHVNPFRYHWLSFLTPFTRFPVNLFGWLLIWQKRKSYYYFDPKKVMGYWQSTFSGYATMPLSINFWMLSEVFSLDYRSRLSTIQCPTLIMRGGGDLFVSAREVEDMRKAIPKSKVVTLSQGHYIASPFSDECKKEIFNFLEIPS